MATCARDLDCCGNNHDDLAAEHLLGGAAEEGAGESLGSAGKRGAPSKKQPVCGTFCWKLWVVLLVLLAIAGALIYLAAWRHNLEDYDCDGDGEQECGKFDFGKGLCRNPNLCHMSYNFGDTSLHQSCRCRKCALSSFSASSAFGDKLLTKPGEEGSPYDGLYWGTFKNWGDITDTCAPWLMPKDEDSLRSLLTYAKDRGFKVRIAGAGHSAGGLVTEGDNQHVMVVSLAEFTPSDQDWQFSLAEMPDGSTRAKVNAGWSLMNLFMQVRPRGFFLPSCPAGWFFQLGGVVANAVHGGGYDKGFVHDYVTRMRVMSHDGSIRVIESEEELKHWKVSFGLLGLILGVELQLEKREKLHMDTVRKTLFDWSADAVWEFIKKEGEADLPLDLVPEGGSEGSRKSWYGQYFIDFWSHTILAYRQKANSSVDDDFETGLPDNVAEHYDELLDMDVTLPGHGRMTWNEAARRDGAPSISIAGIDVTKVLDVFQWFPMAKIMSWSSILMINVYVKEYREKLNDGFFAYKVPPALASAYYFPPDKAFQAMDKLRSVVLESEHSKEFVWNLPAEFRFINVADGATLLPLEPGRYAVVEMLSFADLAKTDQAWKADFKRVEDYWVNELGAKPHIGKLWGFAETDGKLEPFHESHACTLISSERKAAFNEHRQAEDPDGLFASGLGMKLLATCEINV